MSEGQFVASSPDEKVIVTIIAIIITIIIVIKAILEFCRESRIIFNGEFIDHKVGKNIFNFWRNLKKTDTGDCDRGRSAARLRKDGRASL